MTGRKFTFKNRPRFNENTDSEVDSQRSNLSRRFKATKSVTQNRRKLSEIIRNNEGQGPNGVVYSNETSGERNPQESKCSSIVLDQLVKSRHFNNNVKRATSTVSTKQYNSLYLNKIKKFKKKVQGFDDQSAKR